MDISQAGSYDILIQQGADWNRSFSFTLDGVPWDFSGYTAQAQIRQKYGSPVLADFQVSGSMGPGGLINLYLLPTQTAVLPARLGVWDLIVFSGTNTYRLLQGSVSVVPAVTVQGTT